MEEKIVFLTELLNKLKGERVWITYRHTLSKTDAPVRGTYCIVGNITQPGRVDILEPLDNEEFNSLNIYMGNILTVAKSNVDIYRDDEASAIYYNENEQQKHTR